MPKPKILVIDDDPNVLDLTQYHLRSRGYETRAAQTGDEGFKWLNEEQFAGALIDLRLPDIDGIDVVKRIKEDWPETEVIVITGYSSVDKAVEATKAGAFHFIAKPVNYEALFPLLDKALERRETSHELKELRERLTDRDRYSELIGGSKAMQSIYEMIESVAQSDANVLIVGESGTGKELVANAVHYKSLRAKRSYVKINCAALPKELIESELFGHTKGAFTGAAKDKVGLIGQADGGSLLMDEIGEMPMELQPKLLRILQERAYTPVGSERPQTVDFRLICATNRNPLEAVRAGLLREDLYYRINTIEIQVPPLREREEDVQRLAEHFLSVFAKKYQRPAAAISQSAYEHLFAHHWPGNVRELQNVIERAVLMTRGETIEVSALPLTKDLSPAADQRNGRGDSVDAPANHHDAVVDSKITPNDLDFDDLCRLLIKKTPPVAPGADQPDIFERLEGSLAKAALERTRGNKQAAANLLGVYRPRLYSIIKKYGLQEE